MTEAILSGLPKTRIEECASKQQADIDSGKQTIVGVNKWVSCLLRSNTALSLDVSLAAFGCTAPAPLACRYCSPDAVNEMLEVRSINNREVLAQQVKRLQASLPTPSLVESQGVKFLDSRVCCFGQAIRQSRDASGVEAALSALETAARSESREPNLLELAVQAARVRCTVGEISGALEAAWGRHAATGGVVAGVYGRSREQAASPGQDELDFRAAINAAGEGSLTPLWCVAFPPLLSLPSLALKSASACFPSPW